MNLAVIPARYPKIISILNLRLMFFAECALIFLIREIGHERPKQINMLASKISLIFLPRAFDFLLILYYCTKMIMYNILFIYN